VSFYALAAVSKMRAGSAAEKLIALAYADRHNEETGCAYPSIDWLCEFSSLNRKTVIAAVSRLEAAGLLADTGERVGRTRQVKVYRLSLESIPKTEQFQKRNHTETGTVPKSALKGSQKRDTEPVSEPTPETSSDVSPPIEIDDGRTGEPPLTPEEVLEAWNDTAGRIGLPKARLTAQRRRKLIPLIRAHSLDDFTEAIRAIERSPFLRGENNRAWRADFDFFVQPSSFTKLIEGSYDRATH
jgi:pyocin large subunit-like protein